ncbi:MAG: MCE family protein [Phycisphaerales bacterium]|nr:MCE family protein [Phycisphaerales bacterium]
MVVAPRPPEADIKVGAIVCLIAGLLFCAVMALPSLSGPKQRRVVVESQFVDGVSGIEQGTPIMMGGLRVGEVDAVTLIPASAGTNAYFQLECAVDAGLRIPRTSTVRSTQSLVGAGTILEIRLPPVGVSAPLIAGETLQSTPADSTLAALLGDHRAAALEEAFARIHATDFRTPFESGRARLQTLAPDFAAVKQEVAADLDAWKIQRDAIFAGADSAHLKLNELVALFGPDQCLDLARLEPAFDRLRANLQATVDGITALKSHWNEEVWPPLSDIIGRLTRDLATLQGDAALVTTMLNDTKGAWSATAADLQITGGQLERAESMITLAPWTLLGGAFAEKGEREQFTKIARELVRSTTELHLAVTFANDLLVHDPKLAARYPELVALLKEWMARARAEHEVAGEQLLNRLIGAPPSE